MCVDINSFYLKTPLHRKPYKEYMCMPVKLIPQELKDDAYNPESKVKCRYVYTGISKGMHRTPKQAN